MAAGKITQTKMCATAPAVVMANRKKLILKIQIVYRQRPGILGALTSYWSRAISRPYRRARAILQPIRDEIISFSLTEMRLKPESKPAGNSNSETTKRFESLFCYCNNYT